MVYRVASKSHRINNSFKVANYNTISNKVGFMLCCADRLHRIAANQHNTKHQDKD